MFEPTAATHSPAHPHLDVLHANVHEQMSWREQKEGLEENLRAASANCSRQRVEALSELQVRGRAAHGAPAFSQRDFPYGIITPPPFALAVYHPLRITQALSQKLIREQRTAAVEKVRPAVSCCAVFY